MYAYLTFIIIDWYKSVFGIRCLLEKESVLSGKLRIFNNDLLTLIHNTKQKKQWYNFISQTDITVHQEGRETLVL